MASFLSRICSDFWLLTFSFHSGIGSVLVLSSRMRSVLVGCWLVLRVGMLVLISA